MVVSAGITVVSSGSRVKQFPACFGTLKSVSLKFTIGAQHESVKITPAPSIAATHHCHCTPRCNEIPAVDTGLCIIIKITVSHLLQ